MKRRHYKLYKVRVLFIYVSHPHLTGGPFSMNAIIGVAGNVNFKDLQIYNEGMLEAVPVGLGEPGEPHYLPFHVGLTVTTDDYIVIL